MRLYLSSEAGKDGYPAAWHATIKHAVREEAAHRCVRCGHPYRCGEQPMEKNAAGKFESWTPCDSLCTHDGPLRLITGGKVLTVIDQLSQGFTPEDSRRCYSADVVQAVARVLTVHHLDGNKLNCRWWNLAALCQRCHLTIQGRVVMSRPFFLEHSDWFKVYAAGYYAWSRLGLDLTRVEVEARLPELLALAQRVEVANA
jgi:hypothetical protein